MKKIIKINDSDNVAVALEQLIEGDVINVDGNPIEVKQQIPVGHKVCIKPIDNIVIKYGFEIGSVNGKIEPGYLINEKNMHSNLEQKKEWTYQKLENEIMPQSERKLQIKGYPRSNGEFGIRNDIWVIPTVGCVNQIVKKYLKHHENVRLYTHPYGCSQSGDDGVNTLKALVQMINHPNAGGVVVVGLGCENTQISMVQEQVGDNPRVRYITLQDVEDEQLAIDTAISELEMITSTDECVNVDPSKLKIGVECGGSDALSGITANPLVGKLSEVLVHNDNSSIVITEIPEFFGAEQCALNLCENSEIYRELEQMFMEYREYYEKNNIEVYANPSPGNKKGGISTLEEKSLGCVNKIGNLPIVDVKGYAESIDHQQVTVISSPGNDLVATTALGLAGCHMVLFTTGRGTPFGGFVPTVKISTNTNLATKKQSWIDFDAGRVLSENADLVLDELYTYIEDVCNGKKTKNEENESFDIAIFKAGVTL